MPQLTMPNIGEGVAEGTVTRWLKQEGDHVALDEPVVEIETDKAVVEIPSPFQGTLSEILVPEGSVVPIGAVLAEFAGVGETAAAASHPSPRREASSTSPSPRAERTDGARQGQGGGGSAGNGNRRPAEHSRTRQYSPVVLKLAAEHGIDLSLVRGTGIEGRVTRQDVLRYLENPVLNAAPPPSHAGVVGVERDQAQRSVAAAPPSPQPPARMDAQARGSGDTVVPLSATRKTIASRMSESHRTIPDAWMVVEADVTGLVALRERIKEEFGRAEGSKLSFMPFFVQAIVGALKEHPALNATYSDDEITQHGRLDIGIAVATETGLVVPVIRDAGDKSIAGLARELDALGTKARERKLTVGDMRDATLTIDNTGAFGSIISQPIVPVGQAAIITTEAIRRELRPARDLFGVRSVMNLCLSFDHRALDGAQAGAFMQDVRRRLEGYTEDQTVY